MHHSLIRLCSGGGRQWQRFLYMRTLACASANRAKVRRGTAVVPLMSVGAAQLLLHQSISRWLGHTILLYFLECFRCCAK